MHSFFQVCAFDAPGTEWIRHWILGGRNVSLRPNYPGSTRGNIPGYNLKSHRAKPGALPNLVSRFSRSRGQTPASLAAQSCTWTANKHTTPVGFEPARGDPSGLARRRLDHSAEVWWRSAPPRNYSAHGAKNSVATITTHSPPPLRESTPIMAFARAVTMSRVH